MLSNDKSVIRYTISAAVTAYDIDFPFWDLSEIIVTVTDETSGESIILKKDVDYTITVSEAITDPVYQNGTINMISDIYKNYTALVISRELSLTQDTDYKNGEPINADTLEMSLDRATAQIQQVSEEVGHAMKLPLTEDAGEYTLPEASQRRRKVLGFDTDGKTLIMFSNPDDAIQQANATNNQSSQILLIANTIKEQAQKSKEAAEAAAIQSGESKEDAEKSKEAAERAKEAAEAAAIKAEEVIKIGQATENTFGTVKISNSARGTDSNTAVSQAGMKNELDNIDKQLESIHANIILPIPQIQIENTATIDNVLVRITNNWIGYENVIVRIKKGDNPTETDTVIPADGYTITENDTWYIRAFSEINTPSPSFLQKVDWLRVQSPIFSFDKNSGMVTLSCATEGATIRYTTDGSDPTSTTGNVYSGPFTATASYTIKVQAYKDNLIDSELVSGKVSIGRVWGVVWDRSNPSPLLTRLTPDTDPYGHVTETVTEEPVPAYDASTMGSSPFDNYAPWNEMKMYNLITSDGVTTIGPSEDDEGFSLSTADVMVKLPVEVYYDVVRVDTDTEQKTYYYIADGPAEGLEKHPGSGENKFYGRYSTKEGYISSTGGSEYYRILENHRDGAVAKGSGWRQQGLAERALIDLLYLIEFCDFNSEQKIGNGNTSRNNTCGGTDAMIYHTGCIDSARQYRHIEALWGNSESIVDGLIFQNGQAYICTDPTKWANEINEYYVTFGLQQTDLISSEYITDFMYDENNKWLMFIPSAGGGSSTTYVCDYGAINENGFYCLVGSPSTGGEAGLFYLLCTLGRSSSSRLVYEQPSTI